MRTARTIMLVVIATSAAVAMSVMACTVSEDSLTVAPDVVYYNGKIATVNEQFDIVEAMAIRHGRILAVGSNTTVRALADDRTRVVDLQGKTVLPGFNDSHMHLGMGQPRTPDAYRVDAWEAKSVNEVLDGVRRKVTEIPKGEWIRVELPYTADYPHPFPEEELPTRWDLDKVAPDHPVHVTRGYASVVNTRALQKAGITKQTVALGGVIDRDAKGELTGKLRGGGPRRLITEVMTPPPALDEERAVENIQRFLRGLLGVGITSATVAGIAMDRPDQWRWIQRAYDVAGHTLPRLVVQPRVIPAYDRFDDLKTGVATTIGELEALPFHTGFGNDRLKVGAIKMSVDGAFSGPNAWTLKAYPGQPGFHGTIRTPEEALYPVAKKAHDLGWQLGFHAIGDAAIQLYVNVLERILTESPRADARPYIHHFAMMPPEETLQKMEKLGVIVSVHPNWLHTKMQFQATVLNEQEQANSIPLKGVMDRGIRIAYGSDGMPNGPLLGIDCAVTRRGGDGKVYGAHEAVSLEDAIRAYTTGTAYMNFEERDKGSLEVGKLADMVVLSEDIFTVNPQRIRYIGIEKAIVGGDVVYETNAPMKPFQNIDHPWLTFSPDRATTN